MAHLKVTTREGADTLLPADIGSTRKVGHNTVVMRGYCGTIALRYHSTDIITWTADGWTVASCGGWPTSTTKQRIGACLPPGWVITSRRGTWYLWRYGYDGGACVLPFANGIAVHADGMIGFSTGGRVGILMTDDEVRAAVTAERARQEARHAKRIERYAREHPRPREWTDEQVRADYYPPSWPFHRAPKNPYSCASCESERAYFRDRSCELAREDHAAGSHEAWCPWSCPERSLR